MIYISCMVFVAVNYNFRCVNESIVILKDELQYLKLLNNVGYCIFLYRKTLWLEESQNIACKIIITSMFKGWKKAVNIKWFFGYLIPYTWPEVGNRVNDNSLERMTIFHCSGPNINICALWFSDGRPSIKSIPEKLSVNSFWGNRIF